MGLLVVFLGLRPGRQRNVKIISSSFQPKFWSLGSLAFSFFLISPNTFSLRDSLLISICPFSDLHCALWETVPLIPKQMSTLIQIHLIPQLETDPGCPCSSTTELNLKVFTTERMRYQHQQNLHKESGLKKGVLNCSQSWTSFSCGPHRNP